MIIRYRLNDEEELRTIELPDDFYEMIYGMDLDKFSIGEEVE